MARGYAAIGLHRPKSSANIGCVLRAAGCYGAAMVAASGTRYRQSATDTQKAFRHLPLIQCENLLDVNPFDCVPVAIELVDSARPLHRFVHPERAFYIFGPEDGSIDSELLKQCKHVVYVPTAFCMNLAATVNVVLYDRAAKRNWKATP